jgi:hypothetical protein
MGRTNKITKFMKEVHVADQPAIKREPHKPKGLYLLELRSHVVDAQSPRKKQVVRLVLSENQQSRPNQ